MPDFDPNKPFKRVEASQPQQFDPSQPFSRARSGRINADFDEETLQNRGQPGIEFLAGANRAIANTVGGVGELLNAPGRATVAATNRLGLTNFRNDPEDGFFPTSKEVRKGFEKAGIAVNPNENPTGGERITQVVGETFGSGVSLLLPFGNVSRIQSAVGSFAPRAASFLTPIVRLQRAAPGRFAAAEIGALTGSAQGAGIAEAAAPGNRGARFTGEVAGGFLNPTAALVRAGPSAFKAARTAIQSTTRAGREATAAQIVQNIVIEAGENPKELAKLLRQPDIEGISLPSASKTGSQGLRRLEASVAKNSAEFGDAVQQRVQTALGTLRRNIDDLAAKGDPQALQSAARLRKQYFDTLLETRVNSALQKAREAAARIDGPGRGSASVSTEQTLRAALSDVRAIEKQLWAKTPKTVSIKPNNLFRSAADLRASRLLPEESLPFDRTISEFTKASRNRQTTSGDLILLRSRLLDESRKLRSAGDFGKANIADELASSTLDDLEAIPGEAFAEARAFSRALNENFTRGFTGRALASGKTGGARISPETILDKAFAGGGEAGNVRFRELRGAGEFADVSADSILFGPRLREDQADFLRSAASETLDNGVLNPAKLQQFMRRNARTLETFPEVQAALSDASTAQRTLARITESNKRLSAFAKKQAVFSKLLEVEDAVQVVSRVLSGPNPEQQIGAMARLARKSGPAAVDGLKTSILDSVIARATRGDNISFIRLQSELFTPARRGGASVKGLLRSNEIMSADEMQRLQIIVRRAAQVERIAQTNPSARELIDSPDQITDLAIRLAGARLGARLAEGSASGASLVAAGAGSRFLRNILERVPFTRTSEVLAEAARNPKFAATLLEKAKTPQRKRELAEQMNVFLINAGIIAAEDEPAAQRK